MELVQVYKCLCDVQRLRILSLLVPGPLCVCHLQEILGEGQVKVSKQLGYMKRQGLLKAERRGHWMIYRLAEPVHPLLRENLMCLQDCGSELPELMRDARKRRQLIRRLARSGAPGPEMAVAGSGCPEVCGQ